MSVATVERVGVVGAGTMGAGIATLAREAGYACLVYDPDPAAREAVPGGVGTVAELSECDLIVEAAPEDLALKRALFAELASACGPEAVLATNTSSLRVTDIAAETPFPERVVGMHFFNPPTRMKLVEVVATEDSAAQALDATTRAAEQMGRTPIRAKDSPGFVANRLARPFSLESLRMLADGVADAATIDRVCRLGGGFRMGPFELLDLIGLDVNLSVARSFYEQGGRPERWRPSTTQEEMVAAGQLGRKSGQGFYLYDTPSTRSDVPSPRYVREKNSRAANVPMDLDAEALSRIDPAAPEILPRLIAQIANETAFALEDEVGSGEDMDKAMRLGFNWPRGPLELTDLIGPARAVTLLEELREHHGEAYIPAPRLVAAAGDRAV